MNNLSGCRSLLSLKGHPIAISPQKLLTVRLLGGVQITYRDRPLTIFATKKVLALFCYLLDNRTVEISRDKLMLLFWGESSESQARYNLRYAFWNIRKILKLDDSDPDPLIASRSNCQFNPEFPIVSDVDRFNAASLVSPTSPTKITSLEEAFNLYCGPFMDGFQLRGLPEWEEWLFQRREELHQRYVITAQNLGWEYLQRGDAVKALDVFRKLLKFAPEMEPAHEGMIRAYADQGKVTAALRQYQLYVDLMRREFNAPPRKELEELAAQLREGRYNKSIPRTDDRSYVSEQRQNVGIPQPTVLLPPKADISTVTSEEKADPDFVGRESEISAFEHLVDDVQNNRGYVLIISGEMGIGKTRLFRRLMRHIPDNFLIAFGESQQVESAAPLQVLMSILHQFEQSNRVPEELKTSLAEIYREHRLLSSKSDRTEESPLLNMVKNWLLQLGAHLPLVIAFDDLHWASPAVMKLFSSLSHEIRNLPILMVGIFRTFEPQSEDEIAATLIAIARTGRLRRLELKNLNDNESRQLLSYHISRYEQNLDDAALKRLSVFTAGIPLYIVEIANYIADGRLDLLDSPMLTGAPDFNRSGGGSLLPDLMQKITTMRMGVISEQCREILRATSLLIGEFSLEFSKALFGFEDEQLEESLIELEYRNFIHHREERGRLYFGFNHQLVKIAVMEQIPILEKRRLYARILQTIQTSGESVGPEAMSLYLFNAGDRSAAIPYLIAAASVWTDLGDNNRALNLARVAFEVALDRISEDPDTLVKVPLAYTDRLIRYNKIKTAIDVCNQVIERLEEARSEWARSSILIKREELRELLKSAPEAQRPHPEPTLALIAAKRALANIRVLQKDYSGAEDLLEDAQRMLDTLPDNPATIREAGQFFLVRAKCYIAKGELPEALILLENATDLFQSYGSLKELAVSLIETADVLGKMGHYAQRRTVLERCIGLPFEDDAAEELIQARRHLAEIHRSEEDWESAEDQLVRAIRAADSNQALREIAAWVKLDLAEVLKIQGDEAGALQLLDEARTYFSAVDNREALRRISQF